MIYQFNDSAKVQQNLTTTYITVDEAAIEQFEKRVQVIINLLTVDANLTIDEPLFLTQQLKLAMKKDLANQRDALLRRI